MASSDQFTPSEPIRGIVIPADVYAQLETIRRSGEVNMAGRQQVQAVTNRRNLFAAVVWLEDHKNEYVRGFIEGFTPDRDLTDDEQDMIDNARDGWL